MKIIVGIDEVGRGPLAGPVTVCAVSCDEDTYKLLKKNKTLPKLGKDSKKLKEKEREGYDVVLKDLFKLGKIKYSISHISNKIIDNKGISFALKSAISKNFKNLHLQTYNSNILLDGGLKAPTEFKNQKTIIKGDEKEKIIAWASILAKVSRDSLMCKLAKKYPKYGLELHKGYGTSKHRVALKEFGLSEIHRRSFCKKY